MSTTFRPNVLRDLVWLPISYLWKFWPLRSRRLGVKRNVEKLFELWQLLDGISRVMKHRTSIVRNDVFVAIRQATMVLRLNRWILAMSESKPNYVGEGISRYLAIYETALRDPNSICEGGMQAALKSLRSLVDKLEK